MMPNVTSALPAGNPPAGLVFPPPGYGNNMGFNNMGYPFNQFRLPGLKNLIIHLPKLLAVTNVY